jgi:hypothetical protein
MTSRDAVPNKVRDASALACPGKTPAFAKSEALYVSIKKPLSSSKT